MHHAVDVFYAFLDRIGYMHPIHPAMVHMPIGLVVGAAAFLGMAFFPRFRSFRRSAHHATVLALIFWFPTVIFGVMDWQRYLGGAWLFDIKIKMALARTLLVLLVVEAETTALEPARSPLTAAVISRDFTVFLVIGIFLSKWLGLGFR